MKYLKLFENFDQSEIDYLCKEYRIENYTINPDGSIDVDGDVDLLDEKLTKLPLKFNRVSGNFTCTYNKLTSLIGCPNHVGGDFSCSKNKLTSLIGCPNHVGGYFSCSKNKLTSLIGCPNHIGRYFTCTYNQLTSLIGCPNHVSGSFSCNSNQLTTLDGYPQYVGDGFSCSNNPVSKIIYLFNEDSKIYLEYQETYNFLRKDGKIVKHLFYEALKDYNEYYNRQIELPKRIKGYTYI